MRYSFIDFLAFVDFADLVVQELVAPLADVDDLNAFLTPSCRTV